MLSYRIFSDTPTLLEIDKQISGFIRAWLSLKMEALWETHYHPEGPRESEDHLEDSDIEFIFPSEILVSITSPTGEIIRL